MKSREEAVNEVVDSDELANYYGKKIAQSIRSFWYDDFELDGNTRYMIGLIATSYARQAVISFAKEHNFLEDADIDPIEFLENHVLVSRGTDDFAMTELKRVLLTFVSSLSDDNKRKVAAISYIAGFYDPYPGN